MIPKFLKAQMLKESVVAKAQEPQNPFEAFIMVSSGLYYFLKHHPKSSGAVLLGGSGIFGAIYYILNHLLK